MNAPKSKNTDWLCDCRLNLSLIAASLIIAHVFIPKESAALIYSFRNSKFGIMPPHPNPLPRGEGGSRQPPQGEQVCPDYGRRGLIDGPEYGNVLLKFLVQLIPGC